MKDKEKKIAKGYRIDVSWAHEGTVVCLFTVFGQEPERSWERGGQRKGAWVQVKELALDKTCLTVTGEERICE